jgi:Tfp pilus assembly protein PilE
MPQDQPRRGFTWVELVAILVFLAVVLGIVIPAVQQARERARRAECINNMKQIGLGMLNYHDARKYFPAAADLRGTEKKKTAGGFSFLFKALPNMEYDNLYSCFNPLDLKSATFDPLTENGTSSPGAGGLGLNAVAIARDTSMSDFFCPCNPNGMFENTGAAVIPPGTRHAVTNYKAIGATSIESLLVGLDPDSPPPYGDKSQHPDGALFPAAKGLTISDINDGTSNTIMVAETIDFKASTWVAGCDVNLVGMPKNANYFPFQDQSASCWAPSDFNGQFYGSAAASIRSMRTFLAFDFGVGGKDAGTYPAGVGRTPDYGPASAHPGVVNHLFCDGSVRSLRKDIDYAAYFFAITRDGGDKGAGAGNE